MKIAIAGAGYVGLSLAVLLAQKNEVKILDPNDWKVELINHKKSPIKDNEIEEYLEKHQLNLLASIDYSEVFSHADYVIIATPTDYDDEKNYFDTSSVDLTIDRVVNINPKATIVIKSTIPVGYIESIRKTRKIKNIFFSPEFLREGKALYDNLHPSRIIVGAHTKEAEKFAKLLKEGSLEKEVPILYTGATEAEAIKLFSNTYLALRIAYFNELDTYAEIKGLNSEEIINGVCLDPRIGAHYNNPSFGYGGYCLPKDTKQLLANYEDTPQELIRAIVNANKVRKKYIARSIMAKKPKRVGIYRLIMKKSSDNFRASAIQDIIDLLKKENCELLIYEPTLQDDEFKGIKVTQNLDEFKEKTDIILANRMDDILNNIKDKVYTRDLFFKD